ncbi:hypothetical protein QE152_g6993 [Popillia japonica]|uniref:Uncharacterized protein n=1 Tax=Popillia japonica TaxID=7064 RepID=A0AAW1MCY8_POPJA
MRIVIMYDDKKRRTSKRISMEIHLTDNEDSDNWVFKPSEMVSLGQYVDNIIRIMWWSSWNSGNKQASGAAIMKFTPPLVFTTIVARVSCPGKSWLEFSNGPTSAVIWRLISQAETINISACTSAAGSLHTLSNNICKH